MAPPARRRHEDRDDRADQRSEGAGGERDLEAGDGRELRAVDRVRRQRAAPIWPPITPPTVRMTVFIPVAIPVSVGRTASVISVAIDA